MRLLFVSSTVTGGSGKSQRQLAQRLIARGHDVSFIVDDNAPSPVRRKVHEKLTDLEVKLTGVGLRPPVSHVAGLMGRRTGHVLLEGVDMATTYAPENAVPMILERDRHDVVIGSSVDRVTWREVTDHCEARGIPTVLYLREEVALGHLSVTGLRPDLLLANAHSLVRRAEELGYPCEMVPSVVELDRVRTTSSREVALLVNPLESHGLELALRLASRHPDVRFVLQESWYLDAAQRGAIDRRIQAMPNIEFRDRTNDVGTIYRDARVLLVPHLMDNRPRVVAEAQTNGIPVIASDEPGLVEAVGSGGCTLPARDTEAWSKKLVEIWTEPGIEAQLGMAARRHAARAELDPDWVTDRFVGLLRPLLPPGHTE